MKKGRNVKDIPVKLFLRIVRNDDELNERALLIAEAENKKQWVFCYEDYNEELQDLIVCDFEPFDPDEKN